MDVTGLGAHDPHLHLRSCLRATWLHMCPAILAWALLAPSLPLAHGRHGSVCCHTGRDFTRQALCGQCQCGAVPAPDFVSVAQLWASLRLRPARQAQRLFLRGTCVLCAHLCAWRGTCLAVPVYDLAFACNEMTSTCARSYRVLPPRSGPPSRAQGARTLTPPSLPISLVHTRTRMCTRTHTHTHTHTQNTFVYTSTHEHNHTLSHTRTHTCIHTHTHTNTPTRTHTRTHTHTHTHVHTHTCAHTHTLSYTKVHTRTNTNTKQTQLQAGKMTMAAPRTLRHMMATKLKTPMATLHRNWSQQRMHSW